MSDARVTLALVANASAPRRAAAALFPEAELCLLERADMRPVRPFYGPLFDVLALRPPGACLGIVVPIRLVDHALAPPGGPALLAVADHVNLELRGPLSGRWPEGMARAFPALTGVYQPAAVRARGGPRVYSSGVVAGVGDAERLTPFEVGAVQESACGAVSDTLVPAAIIAAYCGLTLAACGVLRANDRDEE